jgi:hypothetical protein
VQLAFVLMLTNFLVYGLKLIFASFLGEKTDAQTMKERFFFKFYVAVPVDFYCMFGLHIG